jgi:hypothetical protein
VLTPQHARAAVGAVFARVRALSFYLVTVALSLPLFVSMLLITPFMHLFDKHRRAALHFVNDLWAVCSTSLFYGVEARACCAAAALRAHGADAARTHACQVRGAQNLPKSTEAAVYVANHQSYLDIYSLFHLRRPFKARGGSSSSSGACHTPPTPDAPASARSQFISKTSNFLIPIIGWSMYLTGHVPLKRMDRRSQMARAPRVARACCASVRGARGALTAHPHAQECLNKCRELLRERAPVLFFPEARARAARASMRTRLDAHAC